ncbi:isoprenylcysteine carboxylmethyltransferase family protein [Mycobacterium sp. NPDC050551]|uniref:methyltransferase family protein n=1 Tax=Mycobacterium sp. NPDC050551 TaxID=3155407 RepID=UPI003431891E
MALQTFGSALFSFVFFGLALFVPAGTVDYWQAWVFIAVFVVSTIGPSLYLAIRDPAAMQRRMNAGPTAEARPVQRFVVAGVVLLVVAMLVVSALDHRFGWSSVPGPVVVIGYVLVAVGLLVAQLVVIQNRYAAATVTVEADQPLASTGLYGIVRHPMYTGAVVMLLGTPPALDSYWGLVAIVPGLALLALRIIDEEKLLVEQLAGYREYTGQVRFRLLPFVW